MSLMIFKICFSVYCLHLFYHELAVLWSMTKCYFLLSFVAHMWYYYVMM
jgi:hypothetical protein